jgi:hypothetical protein
MNTNVSSINDPMYDNNECTFTIREPFSAVARRRHGFDALRTRASIYGKGAGKGRRLLAKSAAYAAASGRKLRDFDLPHCEVALLSLDALPLETDGLLRSLLYVSEWFKPIHIVERVHPRLDDNITALRRLLNDNPSVGVVIIDPLDKMLDPSGLGTKYNRRLRAAQKLHELAREFQKVIFMAFASGEIVSTDRVEVLTGTDRSLELFDCAFLEANEESEDIDVLATEFEEFGRGGLIVELSAQTASGRVQEPTPPGSVLTMGDVGQASGSYVV